MLIKCDCKSEFQDKTYGVNTRVANQIVKKSGDKKFGRCTVCGKDKEERK